MVMDSVTGDSRVTPVVSGDDSGEEEGDGASVEVSAEGLEDDDDESELDESELDESEDDDGVLPVDGAPSRAAAPSGPVVEK